MSITTGGAALFGTFSQALATLGAPPLGWETYGCDTCPPCGDSETYCCEVLLSCLNFWVRLPNQNAKKATRATKTSGPITAPAIQALDDDGSGVGSEDSEGVGFSNVAVSVGPEVAPDDDEEVVVESEEDVVDPGSSRYTMFVLDVSYQQAKLVQVWLADWDGEVAYINTVPQYAGELFKMLLVSITQVQACK